MRISDWSSDVCSSDRLRGNQLVDRLAHVPPTLQVPGELFDELLEPRPALRPRSFRVRLRDWRYHGPVVAQEQRQRLDQDRLVTIPPFEQTGQPVRTPTPTGLMLVVGLV